MAPLIRDRHRLERSTQVGCTRLAHISAPISGKPEIGVCSAPLRRSASKTRVNALMACDALRPGYVPYLSALYASRGRRHGKWRRAGCSRGAVQNGRAMRGVTPALSACRRPLHRRLVESGKPTASPRRSPETQLASLKIINVARAREPLASLLVLFGAAGPHKAA